MTGRQQHRRLSMETLERRDLLSASGMDFDGCDYGRDWGESRWESSYWSDRDGRGCRGRSYDWGSSGRRDSTSDRVCLTAKLTGEGDASGRVKFFQNENRTKLSVKVKDADSETELELLWLPEEGTGQSLGILTTDEDGRGRLKLDTRDGDTIPEMQAGDEIQVVADSSVILSGVLQAKGSKNREDSGNEDEQPNLELTANNDDVETDENAPLVFDSALLLANDQADPSSENPLLVLAGFDGVSSFGGTISDNGDGTLTYTPPLDFNGVDTFAYEILDTGQVDQTNPTTDRADVFIQVGPENANPIGQDDALTAVQNVPQSIDVQRLLANDAPVDIPSPSLRVVAVESPTSQGGTVILETDGSITYVPPADFLGLDTVRYAFREVTTSRSGTPRVILHVQPPEESV